MSLLFKSSTDIRSWSVKLHERRRDINKFKPLGQWFCKRSPDLDSFTCRGAYGPCSGAWPVWTPGAEVAGFKKRIINIAAHKI